MPVGVEKEVVPGRSPFAKLAPPLVEVANPISDAPPSKTRPTWNADENVLPEAKVSGSTSVLCWSYRVGLVGGLVNGSELSCCNVLAHAALCEPNMRTNAVLRAAVRKIRLTSPPLLATASVTKRASRRSYPSNHLRPIAWA